MKFKETKHGVKKILIWIVTLRLENIFEKKF